jgi:hypothetical protein
MLTDWSGTFTAERCTVSPALDCTHIDADTIEILDCELTDNRSGDAGTGSGH